MQSWSSLVKDSKQKGAWSLPHSRRGTISIMVVQTQYLTVNEWPWIRSYGLFLIQAFQYPVITGCAQPFPQHLHIRNGAVEIKIRLNTHPDFLHLINPHFHMSTPPFCLILVFFPVPFFLTDLATFFALVFEKSFSVRAAIMMFLYALLRLFAFVTMTLYSRHIRQALDLY